MDIQSFLNPADENEQTEGNSTLTDIIQEHLHPLEDLEEVLLEDADPSPVISFKDALESIEKLILFYEQQDNTIRQFLQRLIA